MIRAAMIVLVLLPATVAFAQLLDARTMATGGTALGRPTADVFRVNPAYRAVPSREPVGERSIPLPIGLLDAEVPTFDPDDDDFELTAAADFLWNIPWSVQIGRPDPLSGDVGLGIAQNAVTIDLKDAREAVPDEEVRGGDHRTLFEVGRTYDLGPRYGTVHVAPLQVFVADQIEVDIDDSLIGVLRDGDPIVGGRRYGLDARGIAQTGFSSAIAYAREIPLPGGRAEAGDDWLESHWERERDRPRLWVGVGVRRIFGLAHVDLDTRSTLVGEDPILGDDGSFDVELDSELRHSTPRGLTGWGHAWAVDLGAVLRWRDFEFGAGVADLFADPTWSRTRIERYAYDSDTDALIDTTVARSAEVETPLPASWRLDAIHRDGRRRTLGASLEHGPGGTSLHAGVESWVRPSIALRAGTELDPRGMLQFGTGVGVRLASVGFDLGARTHARNLRGDRVLEIGLSLVLGARPREGL
ncbi:MAG TPA: hypothetical protein VKA86_18560 [Candidatus Krumholzibacteria bacterium]|nr:hypothetical protein [Candidatus Krumholzibacteria bacterium]